MLSLKKRSYAKELGDEADIPFDEVCQNMRELNTINNLLGGHKITVTGVKKLIENNRTTKSISICEIGCGGGDNLFAIYSYCKKNNIPANFTGIDIKKQCIDFSRQRYPALNASWIESDYINVDLTANKPDIIFSSLFCHHFTEPALIKMLTWMKNNTKKGFFINDLQRHSVAYYLIKILTGFFSRSYLVKNDAPLSVARSLKKNEWKSLLAAAGIFQYSIEWKWAFRYLIVCSNEQ